MAGRKRESDGPKKIIDALSRYQDAIERDNPELAQQSLNLGETQEYDLEAATADAAAHALIETNCAPRGVATRLGYGSHDPKKVRGFVRRISRLPGVMERVRKHFSDLERMRDKVIARQVFNALYGRDELSVSAAAFLARIGGWNAPTKIDQNINRKSFNVHTFLQDPEVQKSLATLDHEPGEARVIDSEATLMLEGDK